MSGAPIFSVEAVELFERPVKLRMPFRFGVVTLTAAPQAFVRARIRLDDGRRAEGMAAELMAPKWFDKNPALSNEDNFEIDLPHPRTLDLKTHESFGVYTRRIYKLLGME